jgi:predicted signal transduction protein with EAL and GGDEF domain
MSFVDRLGAQPHDSSALVTAAVAMGHGLGLQVVAEGVETAEQAAFLSSVGCDLLQGYLLGRPQRAEDVTPQLGRRLLAALPVVPEQRPASDQPLVAAPSGEAFVPAVLPSEAPVAPRRARG